MRRDKAHHVQKARRNTKGKHNSHVRTNIRKSLIEGAAYPYPSLHGWHDGSLSTIGPSGDDSEKDNGHSFWNIESLGDMDTSPGVVLREDEKDGNQTNCRNYDRE